MGLGEAGRSFEDLFFWEEFESERAATSLSFIEKRRITVGMHDPRWSGQNLTL